MAMETNDGRRSSRNQIHSIYNYAMGVLWLVLGAFFLLHEKFNINLGMDKVLTTIFGVSAVLYGSFRIYRGYKKNY
ncbi:MAG: hypothetical protein C4308_05210 [Chitinophagaceae bacterium]